VTISERQRSTPLRELSASGPSGEESLDLQLNYDLNENLAVSFDAVNSCRTWQSYYKFADAGNPTVPNCGTTLISRCSR
jgi:hypothetical protein